MALEEQKKFLQLDPLMTVHVPRGDPVMWHGVPLFRGSYPVSLAFAAAAHARTTADPAGDQETVGKKPSPITAVMADSYLNIAKLLSDAVSEEGGQAGKLLLQLPLDGKTSEDLDDDEHNQVCNECNSSGIC